MPKQGCEIGILGLGTMGRNLVLNFADRGFSVAVYNRTAEKTREFMAREVGSRDIQPAYELKEFAGARRHSEGRAYYERKIKEGKTNKEALRHLRPPGRRRQAQNPERTSGPGRAKGERLCLQRGRLTPRAPALRTSHSRTRPHHTTYGHFQGLKEPGARWEGISKSLLTTKRSRSVSRPGPVREPRMGMHGLGRDYRTGWPARRLGACNRCPMAPAHTDGQRPGNQSAEGRLGR